MTENTRSKWVEPEESVAMPEAERAQLLLDAYRFVTGEDFVPEDALVIHEQVCEGEHLETYYAMPNGLTVVVSEVEGVGHEILEPVA